MGYFTGYLTSTPQDCQSHQKQGKNEKLSLQNMERQQLCAMW